MPGNAALTWFAGFALMGSREGVVVAVLLEDAGTPGQAADLGGQALEAAVQARQENS
ncbi:hypothetical protein HC928_20145 [bacterium]|nr:hypothetical protein [bacterium]